MTATRTAGPKAADAPFATIDMPPRRRERLMLVVLFVLGIALPLSVNLAGVDGADPQAENREMAAFPPFNGTLASLAAWPNGFGHWFEDHFGFRARLVLWYGETRYFWLNVSPTSTVIKGRNGWLFYADDGGVEDYTRETPLSDGELDAWRETVVRTRDWLRARGIAYVFTIAPDKYLFYPEEMPASIHPFTQPSRMDQVIEVLTRAGIPVVDPRTALAAAKPRERLYEKTDTHWNDRGAFIAYQQLVAGLRQQDPAVPPAWSRDDFDAVSRLTQGQDLAGMMGLKRVLSEEELVLVPRRPRRVRTVEPPGADASAEEGRVVTEIPGSTLPRAVVFRDSFMSRIAPFLSEHFSRAVYLWQNDFDADAVLKERPQVVVQEIVGRHLHTFMASPELIPR